MTNTLQPIIRKAVFFFLNVLALVYLTGLNNKAYATHAAGSDLTYRWISGNIYEVTVNFYRDCAGVAAPNTVNLNVHSNSCGNDFNVTLQRIGGTGQEITFPCVSNNTICSGGTSPGIQLYTFRGNVTLPLACTDWRFSYHVCCRNCAITTIVHPSPCNSGNTTPEIYVEAYLNNVAAPGNSSPSFTNYPVAFICSNQAFIYNHGVVDIDGDSLVYSFIDPKTSATTNVQFVAPYTGQNWLASTPAVAVNSNTGDLTMTPTLNGQVAVCAVLVQEYRNGVLIGSVIRDMQFYVSNCSPNVLPTATGMNGGSNFSTVICAGNSLCFTINSNDANIGQHVTMTYNGTGIPGATFTVANQGGASPTYPVGTFCWSPVDSNARTQPYQFTVKVQDDNCPSNAFQIYSFSIYVPLHYVTVASPLCGGYNICCNGGTATASASMSGGILPHTYVWSTGATTSSISGLTPGTYTVTVTDSAGCFADTSFTISEPPALSLSISNTASGCAGAATGTATANPSGGNPAYTYAWSNGQTTQTATGLTGGSSYSVTVTDANGCTESGSTSIPQPPTLNVSVTSSTNVSCNGQSSGEIDLTVSGGTSPYTYSWSNGATTQDLTGLIAATYTVTVTDVNGCTGTISQTITQPGIIVPLITSTSINGVNIACYGQSTGSASVSVTGGTAPFTYEWSTGDTDASITGLSAGTVSVTITDANGCLGEGSLTLTEPLGPIVIVLDSLLDYNGYNVTCDGISNGGIFISVSGGTSPYLYFWSSGDVTQDITGLAAGAYTVTVFDANGCTATATYNIVAPPPIDPVLISPTTGGGTNIGCNGESSGSIDLTVNGGASPYTFLWNTGATTEDLNLIPAGTYTVTVTDANGCTGTESITLTEPVIIVPLITGVVINGGSTVSCDGGSDGAASVSATGGTPPYTYEWSTGATDSSITGLSAGLVSVTVYDQNGCSGVATFTFTSPPPISISTSLSTYGGYNVSCNGATDGSITSSVTGGTSPYSYAWSNGETTQDLFSIGAGTYTLTVTDANGCTAISTEVLTAPDPLDPIIISPTYNGGTNISCNGGDNGTITVTVSGGSAPYSFIWSNGETISTLFAVTAGTYSVTITDANGCSTSASITLTEPDPLDPTFTAGTFPGGTNISCNGLFDGTITTTVTGGTPPYSYEWNNGETTADLGSLSAGTYTVTITDANGCSIVSTLTLTEPTPVVLSFAVSSYNGGNVGCAGSTNGSIDLTASGGTSPYTYQWSNEATTEDLTGIGAGTYAVTVNDVNGCPAVDSVTLVEPDSLQLSLVSPTLGGGANVSCAGNDGSIDLSVSGGASPYTYQWSTGATTEDLSGIGQGTFTVTVTDANGCTAVSSITLTQAGDLVVTMTSENISCNGADDGSIDITVTGGATPYTYTWDNGATTEDLSNLSAGIYSVTITDANGCNSIQTVEITEPAELVISAAVVSDITCNGNGDASIDLTVSGGTTPYDYSWDNGATTEDLSNLQAGSYSVTITDANGCTATGSYTINEPLVMIATIDSTTAPLCNGDADGTIDLTVSGGTAPFDYSWNTGATTEDLSGLGGGTYSVTVTDDNGCTATASFTIVEPAPLDLNDASTDITCNGNDDGTVTLSVTGGTTPYSYSWSDGSTTSSLTGLSAGTYDVTVTDANGCTASASHTIIEPPLLVATLDNYTDTLGCNGFGTGSIDISVSGGTPGYTYSWSNGSTDEDQSGLSGGTFDVTITDANGCTTTLPASVVIVQTGVVDLSASATPVSGCNGDSTGAIDLTITDGQAPFTIIWSNGSTTEDLTGLPAGTYSVTVTDVNGCSNTTSATVTEPAPLTANANPTNVTCNGAGDGSISLSVSGGTPAYTYNWANGDTNSSLSNLSPGTYDVTVTDANGCTATATADITEPPVLDVTVDWTDTLGCTNPNSGTIDISVTGGTPGYTYNWSNGSTTEDLSGLSAGTYNVTVTDANGCTIELTSPLTIVAVGNPTASDSTTNVTGCNGDSTGAINLIITGGQAPFTYTWSNGETTEDLSGLPAGSYSVTVIDVNGCSTTWTATVTQPTPVNASSLAVTNVTCNGFADGSIDFSPSGGTPGYTYNWSNGTTDEDLTGLAPGTYAVTVTDANGCTASDSASITEPPVLSVIDSVTNVTCNGNNDGAIDITVAGGTPSYNYSWSNGATTEDLSSLAGGTYTVTVTDANNCSLVDSFIVIGSTPMTLTINVTDSVYCANLDSASIDLTVNGGVAPFGYSWSTGDTLEDLTNVPAGNYSVTVTDANGCTASANVDITQPQPLNANAQQTQSVSCNGNADGFATASATGGTAPYSYSWATGETTDTLGNLSAGTYFVTVTDAHGCSDTASVNITEPQVLDATLSSVTDVNCQNALSGGIDISVSGGTVNYSYNWSNGATTQDLSNVASGTYTVTVTDANGCTDVETATIDPAIQVVADVSIDNQITCNDADDGTLTANATGGTAPFTYSWSDGSTTSTITNLGGGTYTVTITDSLGCTDTASASLTNPAIPTFSAGGTIDVCGSDGTLTADLPAGYTGIWTLQSGGGVIDDITSPVTTVSDLESGANVFVWTITNGTCVYTDTAILNASVLNVDAGADYSGCDSMDLLLSGSMSSGTGVWSSPDAGITFSDVNDPNTTVSGITVGDNIIIWTVTDGSCVQTDTVIYTLQDPEICNPDSLDMPTGFSPNGDGPNDFFVIHGLIRYPDNEIKVFNRWGNLVYNMPDYNNQWDGTNNSGEKLPDGTYFVIFSVTDKPELTLTGYVDMRR